MEINIVRRQNNTYIDVFMNVTDLWEINSTIIPDSPVEYLRNGNFSPMIPFLPTTLIYILKIDCIIN